MPSPASYFPLRLPPELRRRIERVRDHNAHLNSLTATILHLLVQGLRVEEREATE